MKRLSIEYLNKLGFIAFKEEDDVISYSLKTTSGMYIGFEHHDWKFRDWNAQSTECYPDVWVLMIKHNDLMLKCVCNTEERFIEIMKFFKLKID